MAGLFNDVRIALRRAFKTPGLTLLVVATFALGIGANTAVFSLFDQVLLRKLPVKAPDELVLLDHTEGPNIGLISANKRVPQPMSYPMFKEFRDKADAFAGVLAYFGTDVLLGVDGGAERAQAHLVSGTYFGTLGLQPAAGRLFGEQDDVTPGGHPQVVLSHALWMRRFGGDVNVVGKDVRINAASMQIVGVAPAGFQGLEVGGARDLFVPLSMKAVATPTWDGLANERAMWLTALARLKPGVTPAQATARVNVLYKQILNAEVKALSRHSEQTRARFVAKDVVLAPGSGGASGFRESNEGPFRILLATAALVLFIGCLNIANLLLTRATKRRKEIALRLAIGGSRPRLIRELVVEGAVLAALGLIAGIGVAVLTGRVLVETLPDANARQLLSFNLDLRVLGFAALLAAIGVVVSTLAPAWQATRVSLTPALREGSGATSAGGNRLRQFLVVGQIAVSLGLLVGAGLLARSLFNLSSRPVGYATERIASFIVDPSLAGFKEAETHAFLDRVEAELASQPDVAAVGMSQNGLLRNSTSGTSIRLPGYEPSENENMSALYLYVNPGFFASLDVPVVKGRGFALTDGPQAGKAVVVNQSFARRFFKDADPIGQHISLRGEEGFPYEVVGVVADFRQATVTEEAGTLQMFFPVAQSKGIGSMAFYVRARGSDATLGETIRAAVKRIDPAIPVTDLTSMENQRADSIFAERTLAYLASVFSGLALLLAALGLYGVLSHGVTQRFREIGVRVALGAQPRDIVSLILSQATRLLATGLAVGVPVAIGLAMLVRSQLVGVPAFDPAAIGVAVMVLAVSTVLAAYLPAFRASRVDPSTTLRYE